jgi:hypothetical protein
MFVCQTRARAAPLFAVDTRRYLTVLPERSNVQEIYMCTRPVPSHQSVRASAHACVASLLATVHAFGLLLLALVGAPFRWLRRSTGRRPALAHVEVQIHLGDRSCIAELERIIWRTLDRAERTWAPLPLPVDRVVVGASFPPSGRADIYEDFLALADTTSSNVPAQRTRRVVVSLGVRDGTRDLDGWEIGGVLAAQINALVDDRYRQRQADVTQAPGHAAAAPAVSRLARQITGTHSAGVAEPGGTAPEVLAPNISPTLTVTARPEEAVPRLTELLATVQQGQPLVAAGPTSIGANP